MNTPRKSPKRATVARGASDPTAALHLLVNNLAALRIRIYAVAADPTCRWAQDENLSAMLRIVEDALAATRSLQETPAPSRGVRSLGSA